jgi:hypothetical protein
VIKQELERTCKGTIVVQFEIFSWNLHGGFNEDQENWCLNEDLNRSRTSYMFEPTSLVPNCMQQNPCSEANGNFPNQSIPCLLQSP